MYNCGVISVVALDDASDALPLARTLLKAGIDAIAEIATQAKQAVAQTREK